MGFFIQRFFYLFLHFLSLILFLLLKLGGGAFGFGQYPCEVELGYEAAILKALPGLIKFGYLRWSSETHVRHCSQISHLAHSRDGGLALVQKPFKAALTNGYAFADVGLCDSGGLPNDLSFLLVGLFGAELLQLWCLS